MRLTRRGYRREFRAVFDATTYESYSCGMTVRQVIHELETLPPEEQAEVIRFAYRLDAERQLSGPELSSLADKMVHASDPAEAALVRCAIVRGFYGATNQLRSLL